MKCPKCGKVHYFDSCPYCGFTASNQNPDDQTFKPNPNDYRPQENNYVQPYNGADNRNTAYQSPYIGNSYYDYKQPQENNQYYDNRPESKSQKTLDEYKNIDHIQQKKNNRRNNKNKKPTFIIAGIIGAMVVIYLIAWATGNLKVEDSNDSSENTYSGTYSTVNNSEESSNEHTLVRHTEIIWKDEEQYGIVNLYLDGTKTKQSIILSYYSEIQAFIDSTNTEELKDYPYIEFVGNVVRDELIECTIKGNISIEYIKQNPNASTVDLEDNIQDLFIPKPLR